MFQLLKDFKQYTVHRKEGTDCLRAFSIPDLASNEAKHLSKCFPDSLV